MDINAKKQTKSNKEKQILRNFEYRAKTMILEKQNLFGLYMKTNYFTAKQNPVHTIEILLFVAVVDVASTVSAVLVELLWLLLLLLITPLLLLLALFMHSGASEEACFTCARSDDDERGECAATPP